MGSILKMIMSSFTWLQDKGDIDKLQAAKLKSKAQKEVKDGENGADGEGTNEEEKMEVSGEKVATSGASRGAESSFHTAMEHYNLQVGCVPPPTWINASG